MTKHYTLGNSINYNPEIINKNTKNNINNYSQ